ncbi:MAG: hypothetical protein U9R03_01125 [Candidatus Aerophobetes bacterium]|nr:hypothetical protein [Candidatus Aerophobetes bacterium]
MRKILRDSLFGFLVALVFGFSLAFLNGCGSGTGGGSSVIVSEITLTPEAAKVTTDGGDTGTTKVAIEAKDKDGSAVSNLRVNLSTDLGSLSKTNVTTDDAGKAAVSFTSDTNPGTATITATADGVTTQTQIAIVKIGAISITADKQYLLKKDSTLLHVQVADIYGNPASGIDVKMTSSNADVLSVGLEYLTTDEDAKASVYATAGEPASNASVTVTALSGGKTAQVELTVLIPHNITMNVTPQTISTGGETAAINAQVTDTVGSGVPQVQVSFYATLGTIDPPVATTNANGVATVYLTSGDDEGNATITASAADLETNATLTIIKSTVVNIPTSIEVKQIEENQIYIKGSGNKETSKIVFVAKDSQGDLIDNVRIQFSLMGGSQGGEYLVPASGVTDADGEVIATLKAGTKPLTVKIKAWYNNEVYTETQTIAICSGPPEGKHLSMAVEKLNIIGLKEDGIEDLISARLADLYSNPVPEGTAVHFESDYSKIEGADTSTGEDATEPGVAIANLYSQDPRPVNGAPVHVWSQTQSGNYAYISKLYVNNNTIYAGTDAGGLFKTTDAGENWDNMGKPKSYSDNLKGLWGTYINDIAVNGNLVAVATEDGGISCSEDGGYNWRDLRSLSNGHADYITGGSSKTLTYYPINLRERIDVKKDGSSCIGWHIAGNQFSAKNTGDYEITYDIYYNTPSTPAKIVKILDANTFLAYFVGRGVWKFDKTKLYWYDFSKGLLFKDISTMAIVGSDVYVTIGGQVYKSAASSADFTAVGAVQPVSFNDAFVSNTDIYYAATEGVKKFDTAAASDSWTDIPFTDCPKNNIKHIVVADDGTIYIGTDLGAYRIESGKAYPLNVYKERQQPAADTRQITLAYSSDEDKTHTTIYVNGVEMPSTYYEFENEKSIKIRDDVDAIPAGVIVEIYYTLKSDDGYVSTGQRKITALCYANDELYFGTESRKVYMIENPGIASNSELPKIKDTSGLTDKITSELYKTTQVMFTGNTHIFALWDTDGDGYFDNNHISIPGGGSQVVLVIVSDQNGRPLTAGSEVKFETDVGKTNIDKLTLTDTQYGGYGITEYMLILSDSRKSPSPPFYYPAMSGNIEINVTSDNGDEIYPIPVTLEEWH